MILCAKSDSYLRGSAVDFFVLFAPFCGYAISPCPLCFCGEILWVLGAVVRRLREVAFAKLAVEQIQGHSVDRPGGGSIIASAFVPHKRMSTVELVPAEICSSVG